MRTFFNLLMPFVFLIILPYQIWENATRMYPDKNALMLQPLLLLVAAGMFIYRIVKLTKKIENK